MNASWSAGHWAELFPVVYVSAPAWFNVSEREDRRSFRKYGDHCSPNRWQLCRGRGCRHRDLQSQGPIKKSIIFFDRLYCNILSQWASSTTWLFIIIIIIIQGIIYANCKWIIKAPYHLPIVRGIHRYPVDSPHKGPVMQRTFKFMASLWTSQIKILSRKV